MHSAALVRRFGWLADHVKADMPGTARARLLALTAGSRKTWLGADPSHARIVDDAVGFDRIWRVFVNVPSKALRESTGLGLHKNVRKDR